MNRGFSLYLDLVRFGAAMIVFFGHASGMHFTGGILWQFGAYLDTAVMIFFVLSGYVIAHVLNGRENTVRDYVTARAARLYSIVIPALILTAVCDSIGLAVDPALYREGPWYYPEGNQVGNYLASLIFINRFWGLALEPGINGPFWSLSFECIYYIAAGLTVFTNGWRRVVSIGLLFAVAGPTITALAPIWFMGYGVNHLNRRFTLSPAVGAVLAAAGLGLLLVGPRLQFPMIGHPLLDRDFAGEYFNAVAFALHLIGIHALAGPLAMVLGRFESPIRWVGSLTFALYLFHRPLIQLLAALNIGAPDSLAQRVYLIGTTFLVVSTFGWWCEQQKSTIKRALNSLPKAASAG